jgi:protein-tyrosine phosphatase
MESILNFRDVGLSIDDQTAADGSARLRHGLLYRSARLDEASAKDRDYLVSQIGLRTIIDLRSTTEHINAAKKRSARAALAQPGISPVPERQVTEPLQIEGLRYENINLNGKGFERALVWKLSYYSLARMLWLMALGMLAVLARLMLANSAGYRLEGIAVLGKEIMQPRGLIGLGLDTLEYCGPEIKQVFDVLADENAYPVLIHCTQGKDRTGISILLVLLLCGIDLAAITSDYIRSEAELEPEKEERIKEINSIGLDETFAQCPPDFCEQMQHHLAAKHSGVGSYLRSIGVSDEQQEAVRALLLV